MAFAQNAILGNSASNGNSILSRNTSISVTSILTNASTVNNLIQNGTANQSNFKGNTTFAVVLITIAVLIIVIGYMTQRGLRQ